MNYFKPTFFFFALIGLLNSGVSQKSIETFTATANFSSNNDRIVSVHNINGSIDIQGYNGNEVLIEVKQVFKAESESLLNQAKEDLGVEVVEEGNEVVIYFTTPRSHFDMDKRQYRSFQNHYKKPRYSNLFDFTIKVPQNVSIDASTMNSGDLIVQNVLSKEISVNNLNGPIRLEGISGTVYANALNQDIDVTYVDNPTEDSYFNSLNGDVRVKVRPNFNAHVSFKTLNGKIYTDLDASTARNTLVKNTNTKRGTKYRIDKNKSFVIGDGGPEMKFDLLNGNVTISD